MTATNHAVTGAIIGSLIGNPVLAVLIAFASHFMLDAIPHFGLRENAIASNFFKRLLITDMALCIILAASLAIIHPVNWLQMVVCAFVATSPDLMWLKRFLHARQTGKDKPLTNPVMKFHSRIQWFQLPPGAIVEVAWLAGALFLLSGIVFA